MNTTPPSSPSPPLEASAVRVFEDAKFYAGDLFERLCKSNATVDAVVEFSTTAIAEFKASPANKQELEDLIGVLKKIIDSQQYHNEQLKLIYKQGMEVLSKKSFPKSSSYSYLCALIGSIPKGLCSTVVEYLSDGDHPWKQKRYKLIIGSIQKATKDLLSPLDESFLKIPKENRTRLQKYTAEVVETLKKRKEGCFQTTREVYQDFITNLREAISSRGFLEFTHSQKEPHPQEKQCCLFLQRVCYAYFTEIEIFTFCESIVQAMIVIGTKQLEKSKKTSEEGSDSDSSLSSSLSIPLNEVLNTPLGKQFEAIDHVPQKMLAPSAAINFNRAKSAMNISQDPLLKGNAPNVFFDIRMGNRTVRAIRTGTPTQNWNMIQSRNYSGGAVCSPEFNVFLHYLKTIKKRLLFISLQEDEEAMIGSESEKSHAIKSLSNSHPNSFFSIILSQDSEFYNQSGTNERVSDSEAFIETFYGELTTGKSGYFLPQILIADNKVTSSIKRLMNEINHDVFDEKDDLSVAERQDFIEIFYARFTLYLIEQLEVDFFCFCCKDSVDRAGKCNALLYYLTLILQGKHKDERELQKLYVMIHASPIIIKKMPMNFRRKRLITAIDRMSDKKVVKKLFARKKETALGDLLEIKEDPKQTVDFNLETKEVIENEKGEEERERVEVDEKNNIVGQEE